MALIRSQRLPCDDLLQPHRPCKVFSAANAINIPTPESGFQYMKLVRCSGKSFLYCCSETANGVKP